MRWVKDEVGGGGNRPLNSHAFGVSLTQFASLSRSHATISKSHAYSSFTIFFSIILIL